ncbi:MAG: hypothetical protein AB4911_06380 [Oscillochloridaceae bacterium umkhey_bin13]
MTPPDDRQRRQPPPSPPRSERERTARARQPLQADLDDDLPPRSGSAYDHLLSDPEHHMPRYAEMRITPGPPPVEPTAGGPMRPATHDPRLTGASSHARQRPAVAVRETSAPPMSLTPAAKDLYAAADDAAEAEAHLFRAQTLSGSARPLLRSYHTPSAPPMSLNPIMMLGLAALLSLTIIGLLSSSQRNTTTVPSRWSPLGWMDNNAVASSESAAMLGGVAIPAGTSAPAGDYNLRAAPSLSAEQIDRILASYGSPATGTGAIWHQLGIQYEIDPAFAVAFFIMESSAGTAKGWAGNKPDGTTTHNVGNIICAGYPTCFGRFRDYPSWEAGIKDWYRLIDVEYLKGRGHRTVADIIPVYAPAVENDVNGYVSVVQRLVDQWRTQGVR